MPIPSDRLIGDIHRTIQQQRQQVEQQRPAMLAGPGPGAAARRFAALDVPDGRPGRGDRHSAANAKHGQRQSSELEFGRQCRRRRILG